MTTKRLFLVSMFLVLGLVAMAPTALAQTTWAAAAANENNFARAEGMAEAAGVVTLSQAGSSAGSVGAGTEFVIYYTTGATNSSAPNVKIINPGTVTITCSGSNNSPFALAGGCGGYFGTPFLTATTTSRVPVTSGPAPVLHIPFTQTVAFGNPVSGDGSLISVTARLDIAASSLYPKGGTVQAIVTAYTPAGVTQSFTITGNPSLAGTIMTVQPEPALGVGFGVTCYGRDSMPCETSSTAYVLLCLGVIHNQEQYERYFTVNVAENFTYALTSEAYENTLDSGSSSPGFVTNGTLISVVLSNIPSNFGVSAGTPIPCTEVTAPGVPCPSGTLDVQLAADSDDHFWNSDPGNSGTATFEYEVDNLDNGLPENVNLPFKFFSSGPLSASGLPCVTLQVFKQPNDSTDDTSIPRFMQVAENAPLKVICFNNCQSNLLFPLVLWQGSWDTDIAISNTTMDPLATIGAAANPVNNLMIKGSATPQSGACSIFYYSGGALAASFVTPTIAAGATYADDLAAGNRIPVNTTGYLWANCPFSQAYGYAAINYGFSLNNGILADYLAVNIPDPQWSPRDMNGDGMGENAVTPLNINRRLLKDFAGFSNSPLF